MPDEASSIPLAEHGGHVVQPEERAKWEEGARGVWTDFAGIVGGADKILQSGRSRSASNTP
ncbi:hypothetical protein JQK88_20390 [Mesorhizobium caraganae]|uniref:hypothetical protein n=1 Tax=Mesorhizobium caraganae TaxID=483206 RepID=UPI00193A3E71|nr:hypothetical protein [Mesorhizobium caraganae]MBM2713532.1 hypothetical protein [Mesorhizobium caraganae]